MALGGCAGARRRTCRRPPVARPAECRRGHRPTPTQRVEDRHAPCRPHPGRTLALAAVPGTTAAQSLLQRSPNLWGGDVGVPGTLQVDASIRYRGAGDRELRTLPTVLAAYGLPANLLVGVASRPNLPSRQANPRVEPFVRWAPIVERADRPLQLVVQLAFNTATNSVDGELNAAYRLEAVRLLGAVRAFSDGFSMVPPSRRSPVRHGIRSAAACRSRSRATWAFSSASTGATT